MQNAQGKRITVPELETYLDSLEKNAEKEAMKKVHEYKLSCSINEQKTKQREIAKIEKAVKKKYEEFFDIRDEVLDLLEEAEGIPIEIEKLKCLEYMLYRVDIIKAEKIVNKATKELMKIYSELQEDIEDNVFEFPEFEDLEGIDFDAFKAKGDILAKSKEQYKLEYTEEEKKKLIEKEISIIEQTKEFNSMPIPHEILKSLDKDIQPRVQKFNNLRHKRMKVLNTMQSDYEKLIEPREILCMIEDAFVVIEDCEDILTKAEYNSIKKILLRRKKRIIRSTKDIMSVIKTKENKTGISNFNVQQARYLRMNNLRSTIAESTKLIKAHPIDGIEEQLKKLKISYEREKQFASVIEKLNDGTDGNYAEVREYERQIISLEAKLTNSKKIVSEEQEKIKNAKSELLVLWKMEINSAVSKRKEQVKLLPRKMSENNKEEELEVNSKGNRIEGEALKKLKKLSRAENMLVTKEK